MEGHRRVGIAEVAVLFVTGADLPCHLLLAAPAAREALLNGPERFGADGVAAGLGKALHQRGHLGIAAGDVVK